MPYGDAGYDSISSGSVIRPSTEASARREATDIFNERKARKQALRQQYQQEVWNKKVTVTVKGAPMQVGFNNKQGMKHLVNEAVYDKRSPLQDEDIRHLPSLLEKGTYSTERALYKERNDKIAKFYYFKIDLRGSSAYLNVAEEPTAGKNGKTRFHRYAYAVTKSIKEE